MKKKILIILLSGILILNGFVVNANEEDSKIKEKTIKLSAPTLKDNGQYVSVSLNEASSFIQREGEPKLPVVNQVFTLPFGSKISSVKVSFSDAEKLPVSKEIEPCPEIEPLNTLVESEKVVKNSDIYDSSELYPPSDYVYTTGSGLDDEEHVFYLSVHCYPVRYSPKENMVYYSEEIDIEVIYKEPNRPMFFENTGRELLIITPSKFVSTVETLAQHKIEMGVSSAVVELSTIYEEAEGRDHQEQIKYFIKDWVEQEGVKYVLLIGNMDLTPIRMAETDWWDIGKLPTDLYYADVYDENGSFCSWDANENNKFSEYDRDLGNIDGVDLYSDVKVGRIPTRNIIDLKTVIGKIIKYETQTYGSDWFDRAVLMGGDTFPGRGPYEGEIVTELISEQLNDFNCIKLWTSKGNYNPFSINREISRGAGFVSYSGHGYQFGFGTSPPNEEDRIEYYTPFTVGMLNMNKYPIIFFDACLTATLDYNFSGIKLPCLAWYLLKKPVGGMVASIGATRLAFTSVDHDGVYAGAGFMNLHFFKAYEQGTAVSNMLVSAQNDYLNFNEWRDYFTLEEFILIGDPSLKVGGYPPSQKFNIKIDNINLYGYPDIPIELNAVANNGEQPYSFYWDLDEDGIYDDATGENVEWSWAEPGVYWANVKAIDSNNEEKIYRTVVNIKSKSDKPIGPNGGKTGSPQTFTIKTNNDPNWNEIYYLIDWGDNTFSDVIGPYSPDEEIKVTHTYKNAGSYKVRVKTLPTNSNGEISEETSWSNPHEISISKSRSVQNPFITKIFIFIKELFPGLKHIFNL